MDTSALIEYVKANPYLAGSAAVISAGAVGLVWWQRRGAGLPASQSVSSGYIGDSTAAGRIVQIQNQPPAQPSPAPLPSPTPSTGPKKAYAGDPATIPSGMSCPGGSLPVYDTRAGTYGQTTGAVVCRYPNGRTVAPRKGT